MSEAPPIVLVFAATDPSGGAGMQADVLTLAAMGCHPVTVVTGLTVQDTIGVEAVLPIEPEWVSDQARCVLEDMPVAAFKLGVLGSAANAEAVAAILADHPEIPVVLDPVLASGRGDPLASDEAIAALRELLVPQATVLTPNSVEARRLAQDASLPDAARRLVDWGAEYVLVTGTHEPGNEVVNRLYDSGGLVREDRWPRLAGAYHGSGS